MQDQQHKSFVKRYFIIVSILVFIVFSIAISALYIMDPLQLFHKSRFLPEDMLSADMREQAPGIIKHYDFDSIILGTSHLENTSAAEAGKKLGGRFVNISLWGSNFHERSYPLKMALRKNLRNVIYSLDADYVTGQPDGRFYPIDEWIYLYDDNPFNDFKRYGTRRNLLNLFLPDKGLRKIDLDRPTAWFNEPYHSARFGGLDKWVENLENEQVNEFLLRELPEAAARAAIAGAKPEVDSSRLQKAKDELDRHLLRFVREYPDTIFHLVFPPFSRFVYANWLRRPDGDFFLHQEIVRWLAGKSGELPNLRVYGFEDLDFPDDIANYKDTVHYHQSFNSLMLEEMGAGRQLLTPGNVEEYLEKCLEKARAYDICRLNDEACRLIRAKK